GPVLEPDKLQAPALECTLLDLPACVIRCGQAVDLAAVSDTQAICRSCSKAHEIPGLGVKRHLVDAARFQASFHLRLVVAGEQSLRTLGVTYDEGRKG